MFDRTQSIIDFPLTTSRWEVIRDCLAGQEKIKAKGAEYLPPTEGVLKTEDRARYQLYHQNATFVGFARRTLTSLVGLANRITPRFEYQSERLEALRDVLTMQGRTRVEHAATLLKEILSVNRVGVLVDWKDGADSLPYEVLYPAESIREWTETSQGGSLMLTRVLLEEPVGSDEHIHDPDIVTGRAIELKLNEAGNYAVIRHALGKDANGKDVKSAGEEIEMRFRGEPIKRIPFWCASQSGMGMEVQDPPFADICDLALDHYRTDAKLKAASDFCSFGTTYFPFSRAEELPNQIGPGALVPLNLQQGNAGTPVINIRADRGGADLLRDMKRDLERQISTLGGEMVAGGEGGGVETAEAVRMKMGQKVAPLTMAVTSTESLLNAVEEFRAALLRVELEGPVVTLSRDFVDIRMTPQEMQALVSAWQSGLFGEPNSEEAIGSIYHALKQGEVLPDGLKLEDFLAAHERREEAPELIPEVAVDGE